MNVYPTNLTLNMVVTNVRPEKEPGRAKEVGKAAAGPDRAYITLQYFMVFMVFSTIFATFAGRGA